MADLYKEYIVVAHFLLFFLAFFAFQEEVFSRVSCSKIFPLPTPDFWENKIKNKNVKSEIYNRKTRVTITYYRKGEYLCT